jgi:hypothetical protein
MARYLVVVWLYFALPKKKQGDGIYKHGWSAECL